MEAGVNGRYRLTAREKDIGNLARSGMNELTGIPWLRQSPDGVSFGIDDSYLITCAGGQFICWSDNIKESYPSFWAAINPSTLMREVRISTKTKHDFCTHFCLESLHPHVCPQYRYVSLSPYARDQWFAVWKDGSVSWNASDAISAILKMSAQAFADSQLLRAKAQQAQQAAHAQYPWSLAITWGAGHSLI